MLASFGMAGFPDCSGIHIVVARASTEAAGTGMMGTVAEQIHKRIPDSDIQALDYPAQLEPYLPSQTQGVATLTEVVRNYVVQCPTSKIVLLGYSQGAHVIADMLCGAIASIVLMGDPSHVTGQPYDAGTSTKDGIFPRQNTAGCSLVAEKMISFCDAGDLFCDSSDNLEIHMGYVIEFGPAAVEFVVGMVNAL
ncbi:hypothetical protein G7046_g8878 [Stylonectria norvegica]|nr:hypothetical protein G7046_g8878 [Stylonectria norvegica]